jgi:hypothetical protein
MMEQIVNNKKVLQFRVIIERTAVMKRFGLLCFRNDSLCEVALETHSVSRA